MAEIWKVSFDLSEIPFHRPSVSLNVPTVDFLFDGFAFVSQSLRIMSIAFLGVVRHGWPWDVWTARHQDLHSLLGFAYVWQLLCNQCNRLAQPSHRNGTNQTQISLRNPILNKTVKFQMSNSYALIEQQADEEWKFARTKLWMSYFEESATLPPPFNIFPTMKNFLKCCRQKTKRDIKRESTIVSENVNIDSMFIKQRHCSKSYNVGKHFD